MAIVQKIKSPFLFLFFSFFISNAVYSQCVGTNQVEVCELEATLSNVENAVIIEDFSQIQGTVSGQATGVGSPLVIQATGIGEIEMDVTLSFVWDQGININWIHGVGFESSEGFTVAQGNIPGAGWIFQNSITGCCSGMTYGPGYYFDGTNSTSMCCGEAMEGNPADNYGISCTTGCGSFTFNIKYCPTNIGTINESITFILTDDGETGDWSQLAWGTFYLNFPITILPADDVTTGNDGSDLEGENIVYYCARDTVLLAINQEFDEYIWSTGATTESIYVTPELDTTEYVVTVKNDNGCDIDVEFKTVLDTSCYSISTENMPVASADMLVLQECSDVLSLVNNNLSSSTSANISNITTNGGVIGTFSSGSTNIGFENGIVLSNAPLEELSGPNVNSSQGGAVESGWLTSDIDLSELTNSTMRDVSIIEFDFIPTNDEISFDIILASDEYCEYAPSDFNDAIGFFLSGPGIHGTFSNNAINIATIPNTDVPITLRNLHYYGEYSEYYVSNTILNNNGEPFINCSPDELNESPCCLNELAFDGFTLPITVKASVLPNQTYHIKLVIGDALDSIYGTAVFINGNSFNIGADESIEEISYVAGETVTLDTDDNYYSYLWSTGETTSTINALPEMDSTIYSVTVSYFEGCSIFKEYLLVEASSCSTTPPATFINPPQNLSLQCNDPVPPPQNLVYDNNDPNNPNSGTIAPVEIDQTNPCAGGSIQYIWSGTDNCGNPLEHTQTISVAPMEVPAFVNPPADLTIACSEDIPPMIDVEYSNNASGNCQNTGFIAGVEDNQLSDCGDGIIVRNWSGTDNCGNPFDYTQRITVSNVDPPTFMNVPNANIEIECGEGFPTPSSLIAIGNFNGDCNGMVEVQAQSEMVDIDCTESMLYTWIATDDCGNLAQYNQIITSLCSPISVDAGQDIALNCDGGMLNLAGSVSSTNATIQWSTSDGMIVGGGNTLMPMVSSAGTYILTATDGDNCTAIDTVMVSNSSNLEIELIQIQDVACDPSTETNLTVNIITGNPPYTFSWSDGSNSDTLFNVNTETYIVTVSDNGGCSVIDSISVVEPSILEATIEYENQFINCSNTPPAYEVVATGGVPPYTYLWADGSTDVSPASLGNSMGLVTVTDASGCTATAQAELIEDFEEPQFDLSATMITCANPFGTATATVSNTNNFIVIWTNEAGQGISVLETVEIESPMQVCATVTNNINGCMSTSCIEIIENTTPPTISLDVSNVIDCIDTTAIILTNVSGQGEISYEWTYEDEPFDMPDDFVVSGVGIYNVTITDSENGCTATKMVEVLLDESVPEISLSVADLITCINPTVTINFDGSEGSNFVREWTFNDAVFDMPTNLEVEASGVYTLVITNTETGCSTEAEIEVLEDIAEPTFEVNSTLITCVETESTCTVSNISVDNYVIQWEDAGGAIISNSETITVTEPDTYCVIVTDSNNGCTSVECIEVQEDTDAPITNLSVSNELNCRDTTATILVNGQTQNVTYEWTFNNDANAVGADFVITESGTFTLITTDNNNGCTSLESIEVVDVSAEVTANAGTDIFIELDCGEVPDYPITLDASATNNQPQYEYQWILNNDTLPNSNTLMFDIFDTGMYVLEVTDTNNFCSDTDTVLVDITGANFPTAIITSDGSLNCDQDLVLLNASSSTSNSAIVDYQWLNPTGLSLSMNSAQAVAEPGIYSLIITNAEGCTDEAMFEVVQDSINAMILSDGRLNCLQEEVVLDATGSVSTLGVSNYQWFDPIGALISTDETLIVTEAGYYSVIVSDAQGCTDQQLIQVTEDEIDVTFNNGIPLCFDDEITLNAEVTGTNPPFMLEWGNGETGDSIVITAETVASLMVTDSLGCTWTITPTDIDFPVPLFVQNIDVENETDNNGNGSISIDATGGLLPYTYLWDDGQTTSMIDNLTAGIYSVTITDANDCEFIVDAIMVDMVTSTNLITDANIQIFPNPTNGILSIDYVGEPFTGTIQLYNALGQKVYQENQLRFGNNTIISIPNVILNGMYLFSIEREGEPVYFEKIIVNR